MLAFVHKMAAAFQFVIARVERSFADFANVPYENTLMKQEMSRILEELEVEERRSEGVKVRRIVDRPGK
jgi:hypothetical protein